MLLFRLILMCVFTVLLSANAVAIDQIGGKEILCIGTTDEDTISIGTVDFYFDKRFQNQGISQKKINADVHAITVDLSSNGEKNRKVLYYFSEIATHPDFVLLGRVDAFGSILRGSDLLEFCQVEYVKVNAQKPRIDERKTERIKFTGYLTASGTDFCMLSDGRDTYYFPKHGAVSDIIHKHCEYREKCAVEIEVENDDILSVFHAEIAE